MPFNEQENGERADDVKYTVRHRELTRSAIGKLKPEHRTDLEKILACWDFHHYSKSDRMRYGPNSHRSLDKIIERIVDDCE